MVTVMQAFIYDIKALYPLVNRYFDFLDIAVVAFYYESEVKFSYT